MNPQRNSSLSSLDGPVIRNANRGDSHESIRANRFADKNLFSQRSRDSRESSQTFDSQCFSAPKRDSQKTGFSSRILRWSTRIGPSKHSSFHRLEPPPIRKLKKAAALPGSLSGLPKENSRELPGKFRENRDQKINASFLWRKFFESPLGHGSPHQKVFSCGRNFQTLGHPGATVRNVRRRFGLESLCLALPWGYFPESRMLWILGFRDREMLTCCEPWVDIPPRLVPTLCAGCFWNRQSQPSRVVLTQSNTAFEGHCLRSMHSSCAERSMGRFAERADAATVSRSVASKPQRCNNSWAKRN